MTDAILVGFGGFIFVLTPWSVWIVGGCLATMAGIFTGWSINRRLGLR